MPTYAEELRRLARNASHEDAAILEETARYVERLEGQLKAKDEAIRAALDVALRAGLRAKLEQALKGSD